MFRFSSYPHCKCFHTQIKKILVINFVLSVSKIMFNFIHLIASTSFSLMFMVFIFFFVMVHLNLLSIWLGNMTQVYKIHQERLI